MKPWHNEDVAEAVDVEAVEVEAVEVEAA